MAHPLDIDFVSDVSCPWCAIGLYSLEAALARLGNRVSATIRFRPFELNPDMPSAGEDTNEHLARKYGASGAQLDMARHAISQRGADVGFIFNLDKRSRIYNTFDAHRLMYWAGQHAEHVEHVGHVGQQRELATALFKAYFTDGDNPGDHSVLIALAGTAGLDQVRAKAILDSDEFADEVRELEVWNRHHGIQAVPAVIINGKYLIQGGEPPEVFETTLRKIIAT